MSERKDLPGRPAAKRENPRAATAPGPQANPRPVNLPRTAGGMGHAMIRPVAAPAAVAAPSPKAAAAKTTESAGAPRRAPVPARKPRAKTSSPAGARVFDAMGPWMTVPAAKFDWAKFDWAKFNWADYRSMTALSADGIEAGFQAGATWVRGVDRLVKEMAAVTGREMSSGAAAVAELGACASVPALVAKQVSLTQASYGRLTAAADRLSQMSVALAEEVCEPIADGIDAAAGRVIQTLAR